MVGRKWLIIGVVLGIAVGLGHVPFLAGAARALADTALSLVASGGRHLIDAVKMTGAPRRAVLGLAAFIAVILPGLTAWLLVEGARGTLRIRAVVALLLAVLGVCAFFYHPAGIATGVVTVALVVAAIAVAASGPLVAAPLAGLAALIGTVYVPRLLSDAGTERGAVTSMHEALFNSAAHPLWLEWVLVIIALLPFVLAVRAVFRR